ncbi:MAG: hypothetical protein M0R03_09825 [Novosphingobium sp.]|nr:hypothetical protein [Novosphingobium sp.]
MRRGLALVSFLLLASCSGGAEQGEPEAVKADTITCAVNGAAEFAAEGCTLEREAQGTVIVRHADGGFRRLRPASDGRSFEAADGADKAESAVVGNAVEVSIATDRYRIPIEAK